MPDDRNRFDRNSRVDLKPANSVFKPGLLLIFDQVILALKLCL